MKTNFDAIVIGAGYVGCSIAYHLCSAGLRTALIDQGPVAAGASRANYGNIQIQDLELDYSDDLILRARKRFSTLESELDWDLGLRKIGSLLPIETENQWQILEYRNKLLNNKGIKSQLISASNLNAVEPLLESSGLLGGLYHADEGQLDPFQLIWAYLSRARQRGLQEFFNIRVTGLTSQSGRIKGVTTSNNHINAANVIVCTGAYTRQLGLTIGKDWPVHSIIGQAYVSEPNNFLIHNHIASAAFFEENNQLDHHKSIANLAISQSTHGNLLIGEGMFEAGHFDRRIPVESLPAISNCSLKYFPKLGNLKVLRSWSAPVADVPDGRPLLGPVSEFDGLFVATAFRSTVIITPFVGELIAQLITSGNCEIDLSHFLPERILNETID
jgi:sarcosine oxidase subunit beta